MDNYSAQFVILIEAPSENQLHEYRSQLQLVGIELPSCEEDEEGGIWKCIGNNADYLETVADVRALAKAIKEMDFVLFHDSSAIIQGTEFDLPELLKFKKSNLK